MERFIETGKNQGSGARPIVKKTQERKNRSFGGVVINKRKEALLVEPRNHFDGYVWTFPKGRPDLGEKPDAAALREVFEETGIEAEIINKLPGSFAGGTTDNIYYLMAPLSEKGEFGKETQAICWATKEEAEQLISKTTNHIGRKRDLAVLGIAFEMLNNIKH
jgi:8-oxo-dGTP diphosphatase